LRLITLYVPKPLLEALDCPVMQRKYPHRAEAIRLAIRDLLRKEGCLPKAEIAAESAEGLNDAMRFDKMRETEH